MVEAAVAIAPATNISQGNTALSVQPELCLGGIGFAVLVLALIFSTTV